VILISDSGVKQPPSRGTQEAKKAEEEHFMRMGQKKKTYKKRMKQQEVTREALSWAQIVSKATSERRKGVVHKKKIPAGRREPVSGDVNKRARG